MITWLWGLASAQELPKVCPPDAVTALVQSAVDIEQSYLHLDGAGYDLARVRLGELYVCVDEPLTQDEAVALHRAHALIAYVEEDVEASKRSMAALHTLQPDWTIPEDLLPREHPLWSVIQESVLIEPREVEVSMVPPHGWSVDGTARLQAPSDDGDPPAPMTLPGHRAFVLQVFGPQGEVVYTGYHTSTLDVPVEHLEVLPDPWLVHRHRRRAARWTTGVLGGGMAIASGVLVGLAAQERDGWVDGSMPLSQMEDSQARARRLGQIAGGLGGGAAVLVTLGFSVPW